MSKSSAVRAEQEAPEAPAKERDFSRNKALRVRIDEYDTPKGALTWNRADIHSGKMGVLFRKWRTACFWRWRRDLIVRSLTVILPEYAIEQCYAYPQYNAHLARQVWTSTSAIDHALTKMIAGKALIRVYAIGRSGINPQEQRRLYLAKGIIDEFEASSKTDDANGAPSQTDDAIIAK